MTDTASETKVPYEPSQTKRFEVSKDPFSLERISGIRSTYGLLKANLPQVDVVFSLYGSLMKGKKLTVSTAPITDIDLLVFVGEDSVNKNFDNVVSVNDRVADLYKETGYPTVAILDYVEEFNEAHLRNAIGRDVKLSMPVELINNSTIMKRLSELEETLNRNSSSTSMDQDLDVLQRRFDLAKYFGLDVGGGLRKYRKEFVLQLGEKGSEEAERLWQIVREASEVNERGGQIPEAIRRQYPQTFEDACRRYGVRLPVV